MSSAATTNAVDVITGVVTVSVAGITAALTPEDARDWADVLTSYAPLLLIGFLIWRLRIMDKSLAGCEARHSQLEDQHAEMNNKLLLAYAATHTQSRHMPNLTDFDKGNFSVSEVLSHESNQ